MNTINNTYESTVDHGQAECRCPDDRCAGYHHEVGETCWCAIFTGTPAEQDEAGDL